MIHDEICTYEVCKLAKDKGFNTHCVPFYALDNFAAEYVDDAGDFYEVDFEKGDLYFNYPIKGSLYKAKMLSAPTQSLLQRWLREEKEVFVEVHTRPHFATTHTKTFYVWNIQYCDCKQACRMLQDPQDTFYTYEEALEDALKYALENLV